MKNAIALTGIKHSGKSSVARRLSSKSALPYLDTDTEILKLTDHLSVRDVYIRYGKARFQTLETQVLDSIIIPPEGIIIATGGGIADNTKALSVLSDRYFCIYLAESPDVLYDRIIRGGIPPFLSRHQPRADFEQLFERRDSVYRAIADTVIDCHERSVHDIADVIYDKIEHTS